MLRSHPISCGFVSDIVGGKSAAEKTALFISPLFSHQTTDSQIENPVKKAGRIACGVMPAADAVFLSRFNGRLLSQKIIDSTFYARRSW